MSGERRFVGGPMDGQVDRLVYANPSDTQPEGPLVRLVPLSYFEEAAHV